MEWVSDKILKYLNFDNGFYLECGANDGITQSNTLKLEKEKNWKGVLIEPSPSSFDKCVSNRSENNIFINCALVSKDYELPTIFGDFDGHLMSSIRGHRRSNSNLIEVTAKKLSDILDEYNIENIDFFSLDVEGYELNVLNGLDFQKHSPKYVLIEIYEKDFKEILDLMTSNSYSLIENLSGFNHENNPHWDGTHNDFLFEKLVYEKT